MDILGSISLIIFWGLVGLIALYFIIEAALGVAYFTMSLGMRFARWQREKWERENGP